MWVCLFVQAVVRDVRGLGVMYAPQLRAFTCMTGPRDAIQQRASLPELTALLEVGLIYHSSTVQQKPPQIQNEGSWRVWGLASMQTRNPG